MTRLPIWRGLRVFARVTAAMYVLTVSLWRFIDQGWSTIWSPDRFTLAAWICAFALIDTWLGRLPDPDVVELDG